MNTKYGIRCCPLLLMFGALIIAGLVVLGLTGCGTTSTVIVAPSKSAPSVTKPAIKVTTVSCGKYTAAQQSDFSTDAAAGYVATITNQTGIVMSDPEIDVSFTSGSTVDASNVTGYVPDLSPGQSEQVNVDNLIGDDNGNPKDACTVTSFGYYDASHTWVTGS